MKVLPSIYSVSRNHNVLTDIEGNKFHFSYETIIAFEYEGIVYCCENVWTNTTGKHLNAIQDDKKKRFKLEAFKVKFEECFGVKYRRMR